MSEFHESIKSLLADVEKFVLETLKNEKLSKSAKSQKKEIVDKITKLKEDWPALATINVISDQVKPSKDWFGTLSRWRRRSRIISWIEKLSGPTNMSSVRHKISACMTECRTRLAGIPPDTAKDDESKISGGSTNTDKGEDGYADSSADIPNVSAMELVNYTKAGFLEKKRPGIGIGIGLIKMQKRWCVIKDNIFYYFSDKTSKKMSGAFRIIDYSFEEAPELTKDEKKKELFFKLVRPANRTYEFMSLSKSDFEDWRNAVMQASKVVPVKVEDDNLDGEIYDAVGEFVDTNADVYDDGQEGDIYEVEPVADIPPPVEPIQDDIYDDGESAPIQEEVYEDASTPMSPPPTVARTTPISPPPPTVARTARPPPPPTPDEDPYQTRPLPPMRALPKKPDEQPLPTDTQETNKENDEPQSYRNEEDFENMYIGKWDCNADNAKELSFRKGDMIYIINRDYDEKSWWIGELNGHFGLVPKNYLTMAFETLAL